MLKRPNWRMLLHHASRKPVQLNLQFPRARLPASTALLLNLCLGGFLFGAFRLPSFHRLIVRVGFQMVLTARAAEEVKDSLPVHIDLRLDCRHCRPARFVAYDPGRRRFYGHLRFFADSTDVAVSFCRSGAFPASSS